MPIGLVPGQLGDLINTTLPKLKKTHIDTMRQVAYPLTQLTFLKAKETADGGTSYQWRVRVSDKGTFRFVGMWDTGGQTVQKDVFNYLNVPWVHWQESMEFDEKEPAMNAGAARIVEELKGRRSATYESIYNGIEDSLSLPPLNSSDFKNLWGPLYWFPTLVVGSTDPVGGFNGTTVTFQDTTTSTVIGGVDRSLPFNTRLRSWVATYSDINSSDFIKTLIRARTRTAFQTMPWLEGEKPAQDRGVLLVNQPTRDELVYRANLGPDRWGNDTAYPTTETTIQSFTLVPVPTWDTLSYSPIVGLKASKWRGMVLQNRWMNERKPMNTPNAPDIWQVWVQGSCLSACEDVRSGGFCIHKGR